MQSAIDKYLGRYAEAEQRIAERVTERFRHVLVVPALGEDASLVNGLAACGANGALCIVVVNATDAARAELHRKNLALLAQLSPGSPLCSDPPAWLTARAGLKLLIIDRASVGQRLPARQGVGLARRIGFDLALSLIRHGRVESRFIASTDADVLLPTDYFAALEAAPLDAAALAYPFVHVASGDAALDRATQIYELGLHYYVEGLRHAGSPYAFHTVGSALAIEAEAYAKVRGFPKRQAGEDFHLLAKIAKLGRVVAAPSHPIRIQTRRSDRVPFGTGPGVARIEQAIAAGLEPTFHDPRSFELLGVWLSSLERFAEHRDRARLEAEIAAHPPLAAALGAIGAVRAAVAELGQAPDRARLSRRLRTSFGALPTLRLVHALRDSGLSPRPWTAAVSAAAFRESLPPVVARPQPGSSQRRVSEA
jgi:hypothetical protein